MYFLVCRDLILILTVTFNSHDSVGAGISFVTEELKKYAHLPFMRDVRALDYFRWGHQEFRERVARQDQAKLEAKQMTLQQFLQAAYEFNPASGTDPNDTQLVKLIVSECVPAFAIGNIYGETSVWLTVAPGPLQPSEIKAKYFTNLPTAVTNSGAISYPDGHPSEPDSEDSSEGNPKEVLSRFWPLGYLSYRSSINHFERTGHVLVMDMEPGRERHPWVVLASEWPDINGEGSDGMCTFARAFLLATDFELL